MRHLRPESDIQRFEKLFSNFGYVAEAWMQCNAIMIEVSGLHWVGFLVFHCWLNIEPNVEKPKKTVQLYAK